MGVIKNLMVRVGADVRGYKSGMKSAANTTESVSQTVNKHTSNIKKTISNCFSSSGTSIKEHFATVARTKENYAVATQNAERLSDKVQELRGVYHTVKNATAGMDLSKPLSEQIVDAEKALTQIESKRRKIEAELQLINNSPRSGNSKRTAALQGELNLLAVKSQIAVARLENLNHVADSLGSTNIGYASAAGLQQLEGQIRSTENELNTTKIRTQELGTKLKSLGVLPTVGRTIKNIGVTAAQAAGNGVSKLWQKLKALGGSTVRGIASLPSKLRRIGSSASTSCNGLGKMVRSIRNIGIVSLGLRASSMVFGELRSIISSYISQNEELNASITEMKNQMGEALLPVINMVLVAMQRLLPVVTAVSNGINSIMTALFGDMQKTTAAIEATVKEANSLELYGFDQITKSAEKDSSTTSTSSGSGNSQSALVQQLINWIQQLKNAFVAGDWDGLGRTIGEGINSIFDHINAIDVGAKFGTFVNNLMTTAYSVLSTVDFTGIGATLGRMFTSAIETVDWSMAGVTIGKALLALPTVLVSFALNTDWGKVGTAVSDFLSSALSTGTEWLKNTDWLKLGDCVANLIKGVKWSELAKNLFEFFGAALSAGVSFLWGFIDDAVLSIGGYFTQKIEEAGGNVGRGILNGILDGLGNINEWIVENIQEPFLDGLSNFSNAIIKFFEDQFNIDIDGNVKDFTFGAMGTLGDIAEGMLGALTGLGEDSDGKAARGAIVSSSTKLEVGEDGTEAIVPLERHTEWLDVLASKLAVKISGNGGGAQPAVFQFILGNRQVSEYVISDINQITHENGVCPIHL